MALELIWLSLDGPCTRDWWALEGGGERLVLVQPFHCGAAVRFYLGRHPWEQRDVSAASVRQGMKFAERWVRPRLEGPSDGQVASIRYRAAMAITPLELAAIHEAAHAVVTVNCKWHFLCDSVWANPQGHGQAPFQMDNAAAKDAFARNGNADQVFMKAAIIAVAGVCAESRLRRDRGEPAISVNEAFRASPSDEDAARFALSKMVHPESFEEIVNRAQAAIDSNETLWRRIERFAVLLASSGKMTAVEATDAILDIEREESSGGSVQ